MFARHLHTLLLAAATTTAGTALAQQTEPAELVRLPSRSAPWWLLLDKVDGGANYSHLDNPTVDGLSGRFRWSGVNPSQGKYDFRLIDKVAGEAKKRGKKWTLRIMAGTNAPRWLDCPTFRDGDSSFPLPWCREYERQYQQLMMVLGARYANDPDLVMVHVAGFDRSSEMHMPKSRDWPTSKMTAAWQHRIDSTAAAFPRQLICLNHSPEDWSASVVHRMQRLGKQRACFQMNALKASTDTSWTGYAILDDLDRAGWPIGFQFVGPSTTRNGTAVNRFGGSFDQAVGKGKAAGVRWYEFYQPDTDKLP